MSNATIIPIPQADVTVRDATLADVAFIDQLQKLHSSQVGFMRTSWIEEKIAKGEVIVACRGEPRVRPSPGGTEEGEHEVRPYGEPVGYCMGVDRYFKRDDVGIIHQMNVVPGKQRGFVGATLLKAMFERAAYGCRLFCCWCAQDLPANRFWEAMGFVPLAYRAGSEKKARVHILWQKRIRAGDVTTPWWFPAKTDAGAMREDRIVLPIPPGLRWWDEMPVIVTPGKESRVPRLAGKKKDVGATPALAAPRGGRPTARFGRPPTGPIVAAPAKVEEKAPRERVKREKRKADPKLVAAARELRDRWLEQVNAGAYQIEDAGKYDVARVLPGPASTRLLPAA